MSGKTRTANSPSQSTTEGIQSGSTQNNDVTTNGNFPEQKRKANDQKKGNGAKTTNENSATPKKKGFLSELTGRSRFVLILCALANFLACCAFSLLGPFYPLVAEKKGMSLTLIGFVFSVFQLVIFLFSPIIGKYMTKIGIKFVYNSGIFVGGSCVILFGLLDRCPDGTPFIVMSIVCRSVEALGVAAFMTASFTIISNECHRVIGTAYAILETAAGLGYMAGPAIGGALFQAGGYGLPFYVMGSLILVNGVVIYRFLPKLESIKKKRQDSMLKLLRSPLMIVALLNILVGQIGITVFDSTFATQIDKFGLSTGIIGLFFIIISSLYSLVAPLWGYLTDQKDYPKTLIIIGNVIFAIGYLFMGPSPLLPFLPSTLGVIAIGLVLVGLSFGMLVIPGMTLMVAAAYELNYEASMDTYALVSGLFNSVNSFGAFLGPMLGGAIVQGYGHPVGYTVVSFISFFAVVVGSGYFLYRRHRRQDEIINKTEEGLDGDEDETSALLRRGSYPTGDGFDRMKGRRPSARRGSLHTLHRSLSRSITIPDDEE